MIRYSTNKDVNCWSVITRQKMDEKRYKYYDRLLASTTVARRKRRQSCDDELQLDGCRSLAPGLGSPVASELAGGQAPEIPLVFEKLRKDYVNNIRR